MNAQSDVQTDRNVLFQLFVHCTQTYKTSSDGLRVASSSFIVFKASDVNTNKKWDIHDFLCWYFHIHVALLTNWWCVWTVTNCVNVIFFTCSAYFLSHLCVGHLFILTLSSLCSFPACKWDRITLWPNLRSNVSIFLSDKEITFLNLTSGTWCRPSLKDLKIASL